MSSTTGSPRPFRYEWDGVMRRLVLPPLVKLVAAYMSQYADNEGRHIRPGVDRLVDETGLSDATVRRAQRRLRALGLIVLVRSGSSQGRRGKANEYKLALPEDILERVDMVSLSDAAPHRKTRNSPVDNSENSGHLETGDNWVGEPSPDPDHRSLEDRCSDGTPVTPDENTGHSSDHPCTKTTPAKEHHAKSGHSTPTAEAARDERPVDNRFSELAKLCDHGETKRRRRDGTPRCDVCRKEAA